MPVPIGHPAPMRDRVGLALLLFGIVAAPLAWDAQLLVSVSLSGFACYPHASPLATPFWAGLPRVLFAISLASVAVAILGGAVSWRSWRRTCQERDGSAHHLLNLGEGRTRFLAMCGLLTSALFLIALAFGTIVLLLVPLCGR
jgi:hypothetical protein